MLPKLFTYLRLYKILYYNNGIDMYNSTVHVDKTKRTVIQNIYL